MVMPLLPFLALKLDASAFEIGLMSASYCAAQTVGTILLGSLSDSIGRRRVLIITLFFCSASLFGCGISVTIWQLICFRALHGFFASTVSTCEAIIADNSLPEERAGAMATMMSAFGVGLVFGPSAGGLLAPLGFPVVCFLASGVTFFNVLWAAWQLPEVSSVSVAGSDEKGEIVAGGAFSSISVTLSLMRTQPRLTALFVVTFVMTSSFGTFVGISPLFLHDVYGVQATQMALMFTSAGAVMVFAQGFLTTVVVKQLGEQLSILVGAVVRMICITAPAIIIYPWMPWVTFIPLVGAGSLIDPCMASMAANLASEDSRGAVLGVYQALRSLGEAVGPLMGGALYKSSLYYPLWLALAWSAVGCCLVPTLGGVRNPESGKGSKAEPLLSANESPLPGDFHHTDVFALPVSPPTSPTNCKSRETGTAV